MVADHFDFRSFGQLYYVIGNLDNKIICHFLHKVKLIGNIF